MSSSIEEFKKILIIKNGKTPLQKWKDPNNQFTKLPDLYYFNYGILTGAINNLLVLDIDVKDGGLFEWQNYLNKYGDINTIQISTPSNGYHYYFKYSHSDKAYALLIENHLTNKTKFRNKGLDIRSNGGYVVGVGSNNYDYMTECESISEMPTTLIDWLLEYENNNNEDKEPSVNSIKSASTNTQININNYKYNITDDQVWEILEKLDDKYLESYSEWLKVTTILKNLDKYDIWNMWSKRSHKYNEIKNINHWNNAKANIDINFLAKLTDHEEIPRFKIYEALTTQPNIRNVDFNQKYVYDKECKHKQFKYRYYKNYSTIILKSTTGTGKTSAISQHTQTYLKQNINNKFLTITARQSLSDQHQDSFKNINLSNYQDGDIISKRAATICINSLLQLEELPTSEINKYIIYIDEIASFLEAITHNETLDGKLKSIYMVLMKLIKHAHKVIVSDALINDGVLEFLKHRNNIIFIKNNFVKYQDIEATRLRNEDDFLNEMIEHVKNNEYFFFGCDSKDITIKFCNECKKHSDNHDKFMVITSDTPMRIKDANTEFKNKFVFYSPKITYGVDFNNHDLAQDVFIYIKGHTIQPSGAFQQATRTRNIKKLYFYGETPNKKSIYEDIEEVKQTFKQNINTCKNLKTICTYINEDNEEDIVENSFFNLFCYQEYVKDIYNTNKIEHFKEILSSYGFKLNETGIKKEIDKGKKKDMTTLKDKINEEVFNEFLEDNDKQKDKYHILNNNIEYLGLTTNEQFKEYKDIIIDNYKVEDHNNIISLLKFDPYIKNKLEEMKESSYDVKQYLSKYHKIQLLRNIEKKYNIGFLEVDFKHEGYIEFDDDLFKVFKNLFRSVKQKPKNYNELRKLYIGIIKSITINEIIISKRINERTDKRGEYEHKLNKELIKKHLDLNQLKNKTGSGFHEDFKEFMPTFGFID